MTLYLNRLLSPIILKGINVLLLIIGLLFAFLLITHSSKATSLPKTETKDYYWSQLGPKDTISFRLITKQSTCPVIKFDEYEVAMNIRHKPDQYFPIYVCEAITNKGVKTATASVGSKTYTWPTLEQSDPSSAIAIIGDTGCRKTLVENQICDATHWPLQRISNSLMRRSLKLVIHVGDYLYREHCFAWRHCEITGYKYASWEADWFNPMQNIMKKVPFLFVRGNHENCNRAYHGWYIFFYQGAVPESCNKMDTVFIVNAKGYSFVNLDTSAKHSERSVLLHKADQVQLQIKMNAVIPLIPNQNYVFLITHKPMVGYVMKNLYTNATTSFAYNTLLHNRENPPYSLLGVLSGHIHSLEFLSMPDGYQAIVGASGTQLDIIKHYNLNLMKVSEKFGSNTFGYALLENKTLYYFNQYAQVIYSSPVLY